MQFLYNNFKVQVKNSEVVNSKIRTSRRQIPNKSEFKYPYKAEKSQLLVEPN